jgi:putative aminopeptidase FrvX
MLALMRELTEAVGLPGYEAEIRSLMARHLSGLAEIEYDNLGSLIAHRVGDTSGPRIMLAAHMDEIGFMVKSITDEGFLRFQTLGGWWEHVMLAQRVTVRTSKGDLTGVIGSTPPHVLKADERKKVLDKDNMFIDIGVESKDEAIAKGVRPGDPVIPICPFTPMANDRYLLAKAWDNRFGCLVLIEVMRALQEQSHPNTLYVAATVQEEVGLRGAATSANAINPDVSFALDVCIAGDTPGMQPQQVTAKMGKGPVIMLYDASMVPHTGLRDFVMDSAAAEGIDVQFDAMAGGGTDAGRIHISGRGVPSLVISVPTRYIHSHASIVHRDDVENVVKLMLAVIKRLDKAALASIRGW